MTKHKAKKSTIDGVLLAVATVLIVYGLLALYSATFYVGSSFWKRQLIWIAVGLAVAIAAYWIPYPFWQKIAPILMLVNLLALLITVVYAKPVLGATRGLIDLSSGERSLGGLFGLGSSVQPGVLARLVTVIYVAAWLASKGEQLNQVKYGLIPFGMIIGLVGGLVFLQPDLSTMLLIVVTGVAMFFFAGGDPIQIALSGLVAGVPASLLVWNMEYARQRLEAHLASLKNPELMHDHVRRSFQALAEGGVFGVGLGQGRLKFGYLPFPHTDSIFSVIGEEGGLIGCLVVLLLFLVFAYRGYRVTLSTPDAFGSLVAFGVTTMILTEVLLNILVMIGIFPPTGTALPFFSYGGTQMLITLGGVGLLLGISRGKPKGDWDAVLDRWWRDGWARLSGARHSTSPARHRP